MPITFPTPAVAEHRASLSLPQPPARKMSWEESTKPQQQAAGQQGGGSHGARGCPLGSRGAPSAAALRRRVRLEGDPYDGEIG